MFSFFRRERENRLEYVTYDMHAEFSLFSVREEKKRDRSFANSSEFLLIVEFYDALTN